MNSARLSKNTGNEVSVATRQINLANALGIGDWERKNCAGECSTIIDTGFMEDCADIIGCKDMLNT